MTRSHDEYQKKDKLKVQRTFDLLKSNSIDLIFKNNNTIDIRNLNTVLGLKNNRIYDIDFQTLPQNLKHAKHEHHIRNNADANRSA